MPKNPFRQVEKALSPKPKPKLKATTTTTAKKAQPRKATMFLKAKSAIRDVKAKGKK